MLQDSLAQLLQRWQAGDLAADRLEHELRSALATTTPDVRVDLDRQRRCGFPEVVYSPGKSVETIRDVFRAQQAVAQNSLATRVTPEQAIDVQHEFPTAVFNPVARTLVQLNHAAPASGRVIVVSAGTSDRPIAEEALGNGPLDELRDRTDSRRGRRRTAAPAGST